MLVIVLYGNYIVAVRTRQVILGHVKLHLIVSLDFAIIKHMKKDLRQKILKTAIDSFGVMGYEKTTMRAIANQLDLAVGNVNYYYPKKEKLVVDFHNYVMDVFINEARSMEQYGDSLLNYFTIEYGFMSYIAHDSRVSAIYKSFTEVSALREFYVDRHEDIFRSMADISDIGESDSYLSTLAMCSLEFELITRYDDHSDEWDFDNLMQHIFETKLSFLHLSSQKSSAVIAKALKLGKQFTVEPDLELAGFC